MAIALEAPHSLASLLTERPDHIQPLSTVRGYPLHRVGSASRRSGTDSRANACHCFPDAKGT